MGRQREGGQGTRRVRLSDQALVAVALARRGASGRPPGVADLLAGLAGEPEGVAGLLLRQRPTGAIAIVERAAGSAGRGPELDAVLRRAAERAEPRPAATGDLLAAALEVGGPDACHLLEFAGFDPRHLYRSIGEAGPSGSGARWAAEGETFGLRPESDPDRGLTPNAALAVARTRAAAGGATELVVVLAAVAGPELSDVLPCEAEELATELHTVQQGGAGGVSWDLGVDVAVAAARAWRGDAPLTAADLLRGAVIGGGRGPGHLVESARRRFRGQEADRRRDG
jgi:hypothetical protein